MHEFAHRSAFGAMRATIDRAVPARLLADPHAVGHFRSHRAADRAMRADALADGDRGAWRGRRTGLRLAHAGERQRAQGRETAGSQARAAQESAAIETTHSSSLAKAASEPRCLSRSVLLISTVPPSARITVDAIKGLHVIGFLVARLALLIVGLAVGYGLGRERNGTAVTAAPSAKRTQGIDDVRVSPCLPLSSRSS